MRTDKNSIKRFVGKVNFYIRNFLLYSVPNGIYRQFCIPKATCLSNAELSVVEDRVNYYLRLSPTSNYGISDVSVGQFLFPFRAKGKKHSSYFFDLYETIRLFPPTNRFCYVFGDIDYETTKASFVKARPICNGYTNSVIFKLNKVRHFRFVNDKMPYNEKKDMLVFRNVVKCQPQRTLFVAKFCNSKMCDVGQINEDDCENNPERVKPYMSMKEMLKYKFIACIEGHDVATNLKWVMSSNSVAVMPRPKIESWFMEGKLKSDYHYIEVKDDYSDLEDKINHYICHPKEAEDIIEHAHEYVRQFMNRKVERMIQYEVVRRYFEITNK
ncbi:MAG: glycosyl transferase family 90 [Prevotella sp.]